jgi:arylsulfatase
MEVYAAMVQVMDEGIGRLVAELKAQGQLENTLILYLQDNGGCAETNGRSGTGQPRAAAPSLPPVPKETIQFTNRPPQTRDGWPMRVGYGVMPGAADTYIAYGKGWANVSNTPFREYKHWVHEGGISTPLVAHWPAGMKGVKAGALCHEPSHLIDIMATALDLAGARYPTDYNGELFSALDGRRVRPLLTAPGVTPAGAPRPLFWEHEGNKAMREGRWKLVSKHKGPWELYDIDADRIESRDLASKEPARVKTMAAAWDAWAARVGVEPWAHDIPEGSGSSPTGKKKSAKGE